MYYVALEVQDFLSLPPAPARHACPAVFAGSCQQEQERRQSASGKLLIPLPDIRFSTWLVRRGAKWPAEEPSGLPLAGAVLCLLAGQARGGRGTGLFPRCLLRFGPSPLVHPHSVDIVLFHLQLDSCELVGFPRSPSLSFPRAVGSFARDGYLVRWPIR